MTAVADRRVTTSAVARGLRSRGADWRGILFQGLLLLSLLFSLAVLAVLLGDVLSRGLPVLAERGVGFLASDLSSNPANAGVRQGIVGSLLIGVIVSLVAFPA